MRLACMTHIDPEFNKYRFYHLHVQAGLFGEWALVREWGRIGSAGTVRSNWFQTEAEAIEAGFALQSSKLKKGYRLS